MSKTTHTPGPWLYDADGSVYADGHSDGVAADAEVAIVTRGRDGALIAAAPDLLEACSSALEYLNWKSGYKENDEFLSVRDMLADAIDKATGRRVKT